MLTHIFFRWVYHAVRIAISGLFLYAAGGKLLDLSSFALTISDYGLLPESMIGPTAIFLVIAELAAALALLLDLRGGLTGITLLLLLFIAVLMYGIQLGIDVDCGCFGSGEPGHKSSQGLYQAVYRDLLMLGGCFFLYWYRFFIGIGPRSLKTFPFMQRYSSQDTGKTINSSRKGEHNG